MLQNMYNCTDYTPNENLNKTCRDAQRCVILWEENCPYFKTNKGVNWVDKAIQPATPPVVKGENDVAQEQ